MRTAIIFALFLTFLGASCSEQKPSAVQAQVQNFQFCEGDSDCNNGFFCGEVQGEQQLVCVKDVVSQPYVPEPQFCEQGGDCGNMEVCLLSPQFGRSVCVIAGGGLNFGVCETDEDCKEGDGICVTVEEGTLCANPTTVPVNCPFEQIGDAYFHLTTLDDSEYYFNTTYFKDSCEMLLQEDNNNQPNPIWTYHFFINDQGEVEVWGNWASQNNGGVELVEIHYVRFTLYEWQTEAYGGGGVEYNFFRVN